MLFIFAAQSVFADDSPMQAKLKSLQKSLGKTRKLAKEKPIQEEVKYVSKLIEVTREWERGGRKDLMLRELHTARRRLADLLPRSLQERVEFQDQIKQAVGQMVSFLLELDAFRSTLQNSGGLQSVTFSTPDGWIRLRLPLEMAAGETVSGSVVRLHRQGLDPNLIRGYVIEIHGIRLDPDKNYFKLTAPHQSNIIEARLKDSLDSLLVRAQFQPRPPSVKERFGTRQLEEGMEEDSEPVDVLPDIQIPHLKYTLPPVGLGGSNFHVSGPFDGHHDNTTVQINRTQAAILAESPRAVFFTLPSTEVGAMTLTVREEKTMFRCRVQTVRADVVPPKAVLEQGEQADVAVIVYGAQALRRPISIEIGSETADVIQWDNRPETVNASQVGGDGAYRFQRKITGVQAVPFVLNTALAPLPESVCQPPAN